MAGNWNQKLNPTGKGGFKDNPQNRNASGRWSPENSQKFCLNKFLNMTESEFNAWGKKNPPDKRTMAQSIAYNRIKFAKVELPDYKEVADRTEGRAPQSIDVTTDGESINKFDDEQIGRIAERIARRGGSTGDTSS